MEQKKFEQKPDSGALFATQSKANDKSPDYYGTIAINIKDMTNVVVENGLHIYKLSGWKNTAPSGTTYLALQASRYVPKNAAPAASEEDEDVPF